MSHFVEKSLGDFFSSVFNVNLQSNNIFGEFSIAGRYGTSQRLIQFVERLEAARKISKQEEESVVKKEFADWLHISSKQNAKDEVIADNLCRSLVGFSRGYFTNLLICAIKLTQSEKPIFRKIGCLYLCRTMPHDSDMVVLLINTIQRDLCSANVMHVSFGLSLLQLVPSSDDLSSSLMTSVTHCFKHKESYIKKRAIIMSSLLFSPSNQHTEAFNRVTPDLISLLSQPDPGVAVASIVALSDFLRFSELDLKNANLKEDVARAAAQILTQAVQGSFPQHYNVGHVNAPYVQVQLLRSIRRLSRIDGVPQAEVTSALQLVLSQPWGGKNLILYATLIEAVKTVANLHRNEEFVSLSLKIILGFLKSSQVDFKYLGIKLLGNVLYSFEKDLQEGHLEAVLECLNSSSQLLKFKTIQLMSSMANSQNYQAICTTLLDVMNKSSEHNVCSTIQGHLSSILKRVPFDFHWCVIFLSPLLGASDTPEGFLIALRESFAEAVIKKDSEEKQEVLTTFYSSLCPSLLSERKPSLDKLITVSIFFNHLFNYNLASIQQNISLVEIFLKKCSSIQIYNISSPGQLFQCLFYCGFHLPQLRIQIIELLTFLSSQSKTNIEVVLQAREKITLLSKFDITTKVFQRKEHILNGTVTPDFSLSFYDGFVIQALEKKFPTYVPLSIRSLPPHKDHLRLAGSVNPFDLKPHSTFSAEKDVASSSSFHSSSCGLGSSSSGFPYTVKRVWTALGRQKENNSHVNDDEGRVELAKEAEEQEDNQGLALDHTISSDNSEKSLAKTLLMSFSNAPNK